MQIRKIQPQDNHELGKLVQNVLMEMGAPKIGTAYSDPFLFHLFEEYSKPNAIYFVVTSNEKIVGGAGIGPVESGSLDVCELQKMYFLPETRGLGLGKKLISICMTEAIKFGYKRCYLETMPYMTAAQKLYKSVGFQNLDAPLGNTGHNSCPVWMICDLSTFAVISNSDLPSN